MTMHSMTYAYLEPTEEQVEVTNRLRAAAKMYNDVLEEALPDGPDKTFVLRSLRTTAMWANVAVTRLSDGTPRNLR